MRALTVIVPTYNRAATLEGALRHLTSQDPVAVRTEIVVVDNNSTDATRDVAGRFAGPVKYIFEPRQGLSHARNAGIAAVTSEPEPAGRDHIIAFCDDDVEVASDWMGVLVREFEAQPEADCIGGRVLPRWAAEPPPWLTRAHWAPLALQDHGPRPRVFDAASPVCLIGANVAFRRDVFERIGLFSPDVQRVKDGIGSTEDHELLLRLYAAGGRARYTPDLVVTAEVPAERLTRAYHRRWHRGHGRFLAVMSTPEMERTRRGRIMGVPAHLFRAAMADLISWIGLSIGGRGSEAFEPETRLCFFSGYLQQRAWTRR